MKYNIENKKTFVEITISDDSSKYESKAIDEMQKEVSVPGFRKGHLPLDMIKTKFKGNYEAKLIDIFLAETYGDVMRKEELDILGDPTVTDAKIEGGKVEAKVKISIFPEVKLGEYVGLKIKKDEIEVKDEDIKGALDYVANKNSKVKDREEGSKAVLGDLVTIDFEGSVDGVLFQGGSQKDYQLKLGSKTFIDTFEDQIVGHMVGDKFDVTVTFPSNYPEESLKGKEAIFKINVKNIKDVMLPKIDDDLAKDEGHTNLDALREDLKGKISKIKERNIEEKFFNEAVEKISAKSSVDVHDVLVDREVEAKIEQFKNKNQRTPDKTESDIIRTKSINDLTEMLVIREILKKEKISVTKEEIDNYLQQNYNMSYDQVISSEKHARFVADIESNLKIEKLKSFIIKNNS